MGDLQNHIIKRLMGIVETELMLLKGKQRTSLEEYMNDTELHRSSPQDESTDCCWKG